ncbi:STAS domain-containing protein [Amycolatopsis viridis]|uniref:Anti-sigma factor antagonist n=1 Tax=Amycolatopsis viridis TaxID=185678 RepID=A0ABX0SS33_9PSEU|nr:STAS domain-containing protein [Amycolatopsis viridis]NIH79767.1 anti-sigma B factor antagonist [Amycolatopsis viridis]
MAPPSDDPGLAAPARTMTVSAEHRGPDVVLTATGELDLATLPKLRRLIRLALVDRPRLLVLDLSELRFVSSSGLGLLATTHREAAPARLRVVAGPAVRRAPAFTDLRELLDVHPSLDDALKDAD